MSLYRRWLVGFIASSLAVAASALSVQAPQFPELVAQATTIVRAEVKGRRCEWRQAGSGRVIVTILTLKVDVAIKGLTENEIQIEQLGGEIGDRRMAISGLPEFMVGDRDYLFIEARTGMVCPLVAIPHGRYPVVRDPLSGVDFVARADGTALSSPAAVALPLEERATKQSPAMLLQQTSMPAADFEAAVRAEVGRQQQAVRVK